MRMHVLNIRIQQLLRLVFACCCFSIALADVYRPNAPIEFTAFTGANESWFQYPETATTGNYTIPALSHKADLGIALSGGGFRAAALGLGFLRALHMLNITSSARFITSNSGGSWLNAAFSFQDRVPLDTFFGSYIPPQQLGGQQLQAEALAEGSFANTIAKAGILIPGAVGAVEDAVQTLLPNQQSSGVGAWSSAIGNAFLKPYGLNADASTFSANGTAGTVHEAVGSLPKEVAVYRYNPEAGNRPFPIILGAILRQDTLLGFYTVEFTPLYIGSAAFFNDTTPPIGGGFVDPIGFNSPPPNPKPTIPAPILHQFAATEPQGFGNGTLLTNQTALGVNSSGNGSTGSGSNSSSSSGGGSSSRFSTAIGEQLMRLQPLSVQAQPDYLVPLKVVTGISSSFITNMFKPQGKISRELTGTEVLHYWNQIDFTGQKVPFADGGSADNLAVTPLLRRRVSKIIACIAASDNITSTRAAEWASYQYDIAALFGALPPTGPGYDADGTIVGIPIDLFNRKLQVFPTAGYQQLYDALRAATEMGRPTFHMATYDVVTNAYQAVFGGWQVEVLWVVSQQQSSWEQALPADVREQLAASRDQQQSSNVIQSLANTIEGALSQVGLGRDSLGLQNFPFIDTGKADYSPALTQLLSLQATWQMLQVQQQIQQLMASSNTTARPASGM